MLSWPRPGSRSASRPSGLCSTWPWTPPSRRQTRSCSQARPVCSPAHRPSESAALAPNASVFRSPFNASPPIAPPGSWAVNYKGTDHAFNLDDPGAEARLIIPVPAFVLNSSGALGQLTWGLRDAAGTALDPVPAFLRSLRLQILGPCGLMLYDSQPLAPTVSSRTINPTIVLSTVAEVRFLYMDDKQNIYTVHYGGTTPGSCKVVEFSAPAFGIAENVTPASITLRRVGDMSGSLTVRFRTEDGSATAPADYGSVDTPVTFGAGVATVTVPVQTGNNTRARQAEDRSSHPRARRSRSRSRDGAGTVEHSPPHHQGRRTDAPPQQRGLRRRRGEHELQRDDPPVRPHDGGRVGQPGPPGRHRHRRSLRHGRGGLCRQRDPGDA